MLKPLVEKRCAGLGIRVAGQDKGNRKYFTHDEFRNRISNLKNGVKEKKMKKRYPAYLVVMLSILFLSGCASVQKKTPATEPAENDTELIDIKLKQLLAISETSLEVSRKAEDLANESLEKSRLAEETSSKALESADKATEASNNAIKYVDQEVAKAIAATNEAKKFAEDESQKAIDASNRSSKMAMEYADTASQKAIDAANEAIKSANASSEKSIAIANQTMAEVNRLRATVKMQQEVEPILTEEPVTDKVSTEKTYTIVRGDTLSSIAYKYYNDSSKWSLIYNANKAVIKNANVLTPGTKIVIP